MGDWNTQTNGINTQKKLQSPPPAQKKKKKNSRAPPGWNLIKTDGNVNREISIFNTVPNESPWSWFGSMVWFKLFKKT